MKYLVSGYIGFDNFGDEAIAHVLAQKLKNEGAESVTFISSNPQKTAEIHGVKSCGMFDFVKPMLEADVLISGGGSLLQDSTSLKSLIYYLGVINTAVLTGKKVIIYSQGIGPINSKIGIFLTKCSLRFAHQITVRDKGSQELLSSWGIHSELVKDPVFDLNTVQYAKQDAVCVQLREFKNLSESFLELLADKITEKFSEKEVRVISLQDSIDLNICNKFCEMLIKRGHKNVKILFNLSLSEAIKELSSVQYLIAMRFHANVIGIKSDIKTIAIGYDPKVEKLADEYNLPLIKLSNNKESDIYEQEISFAIDKLFKYPSD